MVRRKGKWIGHWSTILKRSERYTNDAYPGAVIEWHVGGGRSALISQCVMKSKLSTKVLTPSKPLRLTLKNTIQIITSYYLKGILAASDYRFIIRSSLGVLLRI